MSVLITLSLALIIIYKSGFALSVWIIAHLHAYDLQFYYYRLRRMIPFIVQKAWKMGNQFCLKKVKVEGDTLGP